MEVALRVGPSNDRVGFFPSDLFFNIFICEPPLFDRKATYFGRLLDSPSRRVVQTVVVKAIFKGQGIVFGQVPRDYCDAHGAFL